MGANKNVQTGRLEKNVKTRQHGTQQILTFIPTSATEICTQYAERVNLWIARGNFLSTEEISGEVRREIEKHSISQGMFSQKILRRKQATLSGE